MRQWVIFAILLTSIEASANHELAFQFKGRFKRQRMPEQAVVLHPDHVKFRFCKKAMITEQRILGLQRMEHMGLTQFHKEYDLFTFGDDDPQCLSRGHHTCTFIVGQWDEQPDKLILMVSCDDSLFVRMYEKRLWSYRRRR